MQRSSAPHAAAGSSHAAIPSNAPTVSTSGPNIGAGPHPSDDIRLDTSSEFLPGFLTDPLVSRAMGLAATSIGEMGDSGSRPRSASTAVAPTMVSSSTANGPYRNHLGVSGSQGHPHAQHHHHQQNQQQNQQQRRRAESMPEPASKPRRPRLAPIATTMAAPRNPSPVLFPGASFEGVTQLAPAASRRVPPSGPCTRVRCLHRSALREVRLEQQASFQKGRRQSSRKYRGVLRKGNWWLAQVKVCVLYVCLGFVVRRTSTYIVITHECTWESSAAFFVARWKGVFEGWGGSLRRKTQPRPMMKHRYISADLEPC